MAKISLGASVYRVERRKSEIARDEKWQRTAKLASKKRLDLKKRKPSEEAAKGSGSVNQNMTPEAENPVSPRPAKAPDNKKTR